MSSFNSTFVLSAMAVLSAGMSGVFLFILKSRCTTIKCCCITCTRVPLTGDDLTNINMETGTSPSVSPPSLRTAT